MNLKKLMSMYKLRMMTKEWQDEQRNRRKWRKAHVIRRAFCWLGVHKLRKGFGWANGRRYDCCFNCKYSRWVDDVEGYEKVCSSLKRHGV